MMTRSGMIGTSIGHIETVQSLCRLRTGPVKIVAALLIGLVLIAAGAVIAPAAWHSMQLRLAADDPAAVADLRLKGGVLTQNGSGLKSPQRWPPRFPRKG